jgi:uncharacterized membrane protein YkvA (DUF1232 family)
MNRKNIIAILGGMLGIIYILNPTAGFLELIPDNIPFIGNMDEAAAVILILGCLRHFDIDLTGYFKRKDKKTPSNYPKK